MNRLLIAAAFAALVLPANAQFTNYLGKISVSTNTLPLTADAAGHLFYGTLNSSTSTDRVYVRYIADPEAAINVPQDMSVTIAQVTTYPSGRGIQGVAVTDDGSTLFVAGDPNTVTGSLRKYVGSVETTFTEDLDFFNNVNATSNRRSGVDIISEAGSGLIVSNTFNSINYFKFDGTASGLTNVAGGNNYKREPIYNSTDNVIYTPRNGNSTKNILDGYFSNINTATGGGTWNAVANMIADGASDSQFGVATQHGYYHAATHQLVTVDTVANDTGTTQVRFWNISNNGASLSLAYSISPSDGGANWSTISDAIIIGDKLYVSSTLHAAIYVYQNLTADVRNWSLY